MYSIQLYVIKFIIDVLVFSGYSISVSNIENDIPAAPMSVNPIGSVFVSMLASSAVDRGVESK